MTESPLVTIMIPTYNQATYIQQAIESALAQDYENLEIIISDDQSTDETEVIVRNIEKNNPKVKYIYNPINLGRVANYRKTLYEYSSGKYVLNLDGDDLLIDSSFVSNAVDLFMTYPDIYLLVGCKQYNYKSGIVKKFHKINSDVLQISGLDFVFNLFRKYEFSHLTTIYNRTEAIKNDFYRVNIISSDIESLLRLAIHGNVVLYNKIVGQWNQTGDNESMNQSFKSSIENLVWIENVNTALVNQVNFVKRFLWRVRMKFVYANPIIFSIRNQKTISISQLVLIFKRKVFIIGLFKIGIILCNKFRASHKPV